MGVTHERAAIYMCSFGFIIGLPYCFDVGAGWLTVIGTSPV